MKLKYEKNKKDVQTVLDAISRKDELSEAKKGVSLQTLALHLAERRLIAEKESNN
jgi:hypothetical protein